MEIRKQRYRDTEIQKQRTRRVSIRPSIPKWSAVNALIGWTLPITVETMGRGALSAFTLISVNYRNFAVRTLVTSWILLFRYHWERIEGETGISDSVCSVYNPIYLYSCSIYISTLYNQCLDSRVRYMSGTSDGTSLKWLMNLHARGVQALTFWMAPWKRLIRWDPSA